MRSERVLFPGLLLCLASVWVFGCESEKKTDGSTVSIKGRIVDKGDAWRFDESKLKLPKGVSMPPGITAGGTSPVQIVFFIDGPESRSVNAPVNAETGAFDIPAIKPGRYKVAVFMTTAIPGAGDPFGNRFTIANTKIVRDVAAGEDVVIDISKPLGK